jgi:hypothetical protein
MCFSFCDVSSPTTSSTTSSVHSSPATDELVQALSPVLSYNISPTSASTSPHIKKSPSRRFPHMPPSVMKILAPDIEMPTITNEIDKTNYRKKQDIIVNKLMQFVEEEPNEIKH